MRLILRQSWSEKTITLTGPKVVPGRSGRLALFAPHTSGWYLYALSGGTPPVLVNRTAVTGGVSLSVGDLIQVGRAVLTVEEVDTSGTEPFEAGDCLTVCRVEAAGTGVAVADDRPVLIGSASHCHVRLPAGDRVLTEHALLARLDGRWLLYDLGSPGGITDGGVSRRWIAVRDGDEFQLGPVALAFEIDDRHEVAPRNPAVEDTVESVAAGDTYTGPSTGCPVPVAGAAEGAVAAAARPSGGPALPTRRVSAAEAYARAVCSWVQATHKAGPGAPPPPPRGVEIGPLGDLAREVFRQPFDRRGLARLAGYFRDEGWPDLYRVLLRRVVHLDPADPHPAVLLAEAYLAAGRDPATPPADRPRHLAEAERFAGYAARAAPPPLGLAELRTAIGTELTLTHLPTAS